MTFGESVRYTALCLLIFAIAINEYRLNYVPRDANAEQEASVVGEVSRFEIAGPPQLEIPLERYNPDVGTDLDDDQTATDATVDDKCYSSAGQCPTISQ